MLKKIHRGLIGLLIVTFVATLFSITFLRGQTTHAASSSANPAFLFADNANPAYASQDTFGAFGFRAKETITLFWNYHQHYQVKVGTATADNQGSAVFNVTVPSEPNLGNVNVAAIGETSELIATTTVFESPAARLNPSQGHLGTTVDVTGGAFGGTEGVMVSYGGTVVASATTSRPCDFQTAFTIPNTIIGLVTVQATGDISAVSASTPFAVLANLQITPNTGPSGTVITVNGNTYAGFSMINIYWVDPSTGTQTFLTDVFTSPAGTFTTTITAPAGLVSGLTYFVRTLDTTTSVTTEVQFLAQ
jgi:hypothetical protein